MRCAENETQRQITPTIIFENLTAAVRLGEQMLNASATVEEFNDRLKTSNCLPANKCFDPEYFTRAKSQLASGEGLGRGFLLHFLGERKSMAPATVQTVLDTYYAESRKAAAEKRLSAGRQAKSGFKNLAATNFRPRLTFSHNRLLDLC